jgi:hypothetical protein
MKTSALCLAALFALASSHALAATLDDFSGTTAADSANYNTLLSFGGSGAPFSINGSNQLQPTGSVGTTTTYLWNAGETFALGDTVSIDIVNVDGASNLAGFAFTTNPNSTENPSDNYIFVGLLAEAGSSGNPATSGGVDVNNESSAGTSALDFAAGSVTESATRTATGFDFTFSGPGLTDGPITGSYTDAAYTGQTVYFGINIYAGDSPGGQIVDNLDFTEAPEPSTYALLLGGIGLLILVRHNRTRFGA